MYHSRLAADSSCIQHSTLRIYSAPVGVAENCDERVCLSVCLSVREHISRTTCPIFTNFCERSYTAAALR